MPLKLFKCDETIPERQLHCYIKAPGEDITQFLPSSNIETIPGFAFRARLQLLRGEARDRRRP